jgi:hypothetical protein
VTGGEEGERYPGGSKANRQDYVSEQEGNQAISETGGG